MLDIFEIARSADALAAIADSAPLSTPVPTCGEWTLDDLVWHLTQVQLFWGHIIANRPAGPETYEQPTRPPHELGAGLRAAGHDLVELLTHAGADERAWSWADDHTVGFTIRRQIHESLIHFIDGVLATGQAIPDVEPRLAADGVDEMVRVMLGGTPAWARFEPSPLVVELRASDTGDQWVMRTGRVVGTEPDSGNHVELDGYEVEPSATPIAAIEAPALDLLLWMWGRRPKFDLDSSSAIAAAEALRQTIVDASR